MAKYFLGSVGTAEAFRLDGNGNKTFMFRATSLTDSSINISSSLDEIRGGTGAPVVATFSHDATVEINLTDVFWNHKYVEAQLGVSFAGSTSDYQGEELVAANNKITLTKTPLSVYLPCSAEAQTVIWFTEKGADEWKMFDGTINTRELVGDGIATGKTYCVRYLASDDQARDAWVTSNIIPQELYLIITTPIYAGDACAASNGQAAGHITFEVPRFKLNAAQDFAFAMSSNVNMSLAGKALAYLDGCNTENGSNLLRIIENIKDRTWYEGLTAIYIDPNFAGAKAGEIVPVYGVYGNSGVALLDDTKEELAFSFASHTVTVTLTLGGSVFDTDSILVDNAVVSVGEHTGILA